MGEYTREVRWLHPHEFQEHVIRELCSIGESLKTINQQLGDIVTAQDDINSAVAALQNDETGLDASVQAIQAEIANLTNAGVDTTALTAEVANLQAHVDNVAALAPAAPADGTTPAG